MSAERPRAVAFILARDGSKGLPGKNVRPLGGRPLIAWTIRTALSTSAVDRVIVSTDGEAIAQAGRAAGAEVLARPAHLAGDAALPKDALRFHLAELERDGERPDIVLLLQPTSPLRGVEDVEACLRMLTDDAFDSAVTFCEASTHPYQTFRMVDGAPAAFVPDQDPWRPRQALPPAYAPNGAVYAAWREPLLADPGAGFMVGRAAMVIMPPERSIDIDTQADFAAAEALISGAAAQ